MGFSFAFKLDRSFYIVSIAKTVIKKIGILIRSIMFLPSEIRLCLFKATIWPCMEHYCQFWSSVANCCLDMLDKLQKHMWDCWFYIAILHCQILACLMCLSVSLSLFLSLSFSLFLSLSLYIRVSSFPGLISVARVNE